MHEHRTGLGVGAQQARQILDGLFEPVFSAAAQGPFHQYDGDADKNHGDHESFDGRKGKAKIGRGPHAQPGKCDENVNQALHG